MKKSVSNIIMATVILALGACNNGKNDPPSDEPVYPVSEVLCLTDSARTDVEYFDALCKTFVRDTLRGAPPVEHAPIKAFTIRAEDLFAALGMPDTNIKPLYTHARVYLAYRIDVGFKLYVVPVEGADLNSGNAGTDVLIDSTGHANPNSELNKYVLDLNAPCPSICDQNSPLMQH
jgi:hypothetical protein